MQRIEVGRRRIASDSDRICAKVTRITTGWKRMSSRLQRIDV